MRQLQISCLALEYARDDALGAGEFFFVTYKKIAPEEEEEK